MTTIGAQIKNLMQGEEIDSSGGDDADAHSDIDID
jgi:hypothetical protein